MLDEDELAGVDNVARLEDAALELSDVEEVADDEELTTLSRDGELAVTEDDTEEDDTEEDEEAGLDSKAANDEDNDDPLEAVELLEGITLLDANLPVHLPNPA
jgi:hypothetical protein